MSDYSKINVLKLSSELNLGDKVYYRTKTKPLSNKYLVLDSNNYYYYLKLNGFAGTDELCVNDFSLGSFKVYYNYVGIYSVEKRYPKPNQLALNF